VQSRCAPCKTRSTNLLLHYPLKLNQVCTDKVAADDDPRGNENVEAQSLSETLRPAVSADGRRHPRFKFETDIRVVSRTVGLLKGHTVDISESGISAMLRLDLPVGELVQLEFEVPAGPVAVRALVRYQTAFRYGFQFVEPEEKGLIKTTCENLAMLQGYVQQSATRR
jgi:PilZ domain